MTVTRKPTNFICLTITMTVTLNLIDINMTKTAMFVLIKRMMEQCTWYMAHGLPLDSLLVQSMQMSSSSSSKIVL